MTKVNWRQIILIGCFLLPLLAMAYVGHYSRYISDEYCIAHQAMTKGVWGSTLFWYNNWSGKYTAFSIWGLIGTAGTWVPPLLPLLVLLSWFGTAAWTLSQITTGLRFPRPVFTAVLGASILITATLSGVPSIIQSLYWIGGSLLYTIPLIALTFYVGYFIRILRFHPHDKIPLSGMIATSVLTFAAGGSSEVYAAFQITVLALLLLCCVRFVPTTVRRTAIILLATSLIAAVTALIIMAAAPGNAARRAFFPSLPWTEVIYRTFYVTISYIAGDFGLFTPSIQLTSLFISMLTLYQIEPLDSRLRLRPQQVYRWLGISAGAAIILIIACIAPPVYATSDVPPMRIYVMPHLVLVITSMFWGALMGLGARYRKPHLLPSPARQTILTAATILLLVIGPLYSTLHILAEGAEFHTYAEEWDNQDRAIRAAAANGAQTIEVPAMTVDIGVKAGLETLGPDPSGWVNQCAAQYYGVQSIRAYSQAAGE